VELEDLRVQVYGCFAETGRAPSAAELAGQLTVGEQEVEGGLRRLAKARHVVLDSAGQIVMAHPFAAVPLGFAVMGTRTLWWGGCAWDSFALPHLLPDQAPMLVSTRCPACERVHAWDVDPSQPPAGTQVAHFLVPVAHMWQDVVRTCSNQRIFCSTACVDAWLDRTGHARGDVIALGTLWRLAAHWYDGRLEPGYSRRDPATAAAYFRDVGLSGPFWEPQPVQSR
jgi:hypothetical protein